MKFKKIYNGRALYTTHDRIWVARGMTFYAIDYSGKRVSRKYSVGGAIEKFIGLFRLSRQALRVGIHHLLPLANGNILVSLKRRILILSQDGQIVSTFTGLGQQACTSRHLRITKRINIFCRVSS